MGEFFSRLPVLKSDRLEQGRDLLAGSSSDRPAEWNLFARTIAGQHGGRIGGIEREKQDAELSRVGRSFGQRRFQLADVRDTGRPATRVDRQQDDRVAGEFRQCDERVRSRRSSSPVRPLVPACGETFSTNARRRRADRASISDESRE